MSVPREGITIDYFAALARKTLLNPLLTIPVAAGTTATLPSSVANLAWVSRLKQARPLIVAATVLGVTLRLNGLLNWGCNNNWTRNKGSTGWNWDDEIVLITGGSSGIGAILARQLLARNPRTRIVIVDYVPLAWTPPKDARVSYFQCDLSDSSQLRSVCAAIRESVGHPTVLINNAGVCRGFGLCEGTHADVEFTIRTNLVAPFLLVQEFLPEMARRNHGHIVNMGSMSSLMPPSKMADYSATKAGLTALHESLQLELQNVHKAPGVRLTLGIFSFIRTPLFTGNTNQNKFVFPLLEPETVADSLSKAIYSGYGGTIYMPGIMHVLATMRGGPEWLWRLLRGGTKDIGLDFTGKQKIDPETGALVNS